MLKGTGKNFSLLLGSWQSIPSSKFYPRLLVFSSVSAALFPSQVSSHFTDPVGSQTLSLLERSWNWDEVRGPTMSKKTGTSHRKTWRKLSKKTCGKPSNISWSLQAGILYKHHWWNRNWPNWWWLWELDENWDRIQHNWGQILTLNWQKKTFKRKRPRPRQDIQWTSFHRGFAYESLNV